jgi:alanine racemase
VTGPSRRRPAWVEIDEGALRHNAAVLRQVCHPAALCAVVKADGYGHGAVTAARAAVAGGASWLAVATVDEGLALREAGLSAPVLLLSEPAPEAMADARASDLVPTLYTARGVDAARQAVRAAPARGRWAVQVKVDTGMHRVGCPPPELGPLAAAVAASPELELGGVWTHLAVADDPSPEARAFTAEQLDRYRRAVELLGRAGVAVGLRHVANSAAALVHPATRLDLVRCGIALYGLAPSPALADRCAALGLRPALSWRARVSHVRRLPAGSRPSYGRRRPLPAPSTVAVVPVGYADGFPRRAFDVGGTVVIGGRPRPLAGVVTMDQIVVDCGDDPVVVGDEVVLIGEQGEAQRTAWAWAEELGTIAYEVVCAIGARVPRVAARSVEDPGPRDGFAPVGGGGEEREPWS